MRMKTTTARKTRNDPVTQPSRAPNTKAAVTTAPLSFCRAFTVLPPLVLEPVDPKCSTRSTDLGVALLQLLRDLLVRVLLRRRSVGEGFLLRLAAGADAAKVDIDRGAGHFHRPELRRVALDELEPARLRLDRHALFSFLLG